jgi:exopolysaccharide biosynthesis protein
VDLANPSVVLRVSPGGPDPDADGRWQTTLMPTSQVASREGFDVAVNGDFFLAKDITDAEGVLSRYREGQWAVVSGPAVTDGKAWSPVADPKPCLLIRKDRKATIGLYPRPLDDAWQMLAGNLMMVDKGKPTIERSPARHPRTAVGIDQEGTMLLILVVDGRMPGVSVGMTHAELQQQLLRLGCYMAFNLDGGGSSTLVMRDPQSGKCRVINSPSDFRERAVANVLGVTIMKGPVPATPRAGD